MRILYFDPKNLSTLTCEGVLANPSFRLQLRRTTGFVRSYALGTLCEQIVGALEKDTGYVVADRILYLVLGYGNTSIYSIM